MGPPRINQPGSAGPGLVQVSAGPSLVQVSAGPLHTAAASGQMMPLV